MKKLLRKIPFIRRADDWTDRLYPEEKTLVFAIGVLMWLALIYVVML